MPPKTLDCAKTKEALCYLSKRFFLKKQII